MDLPGETIDVYECKRQKDILDLLDDCLENEKLWLARKELISNQFENVFRGYISTPFEDDAFHILYTDGSTYDKLDGIEDGIYKKKNIKAIVYDSADGTRVYGAYTVNDYGIVSIKYN